MPAKEFDAKLKLVERFKTSTLKTLSQPLLVLIKKENT